MWASRSYDFEGSIYTHKQVDWISESRKSQDYASTHFKEIAFPTLWSCCIDNVL